MCKKVAVLLSTFNGEKYLGELLDSVLKQRDVELTIFVRDDGSTDGTKRILNKYVHDNRFVIEFSENIGFVKSFWSILQNVNGYDYYAFCDQDDIWLPDKLSDAIGELRGYENVPALYTSNVQLINANSEKVSGKTFDGRVLNVYESFQKSILPGCTFVFNENARYLAAQYNGSMYSHDWAMYCIVNTFGKVVFDKKRYPVFYRVHGSNTIGTENILKFLTKRLKNLMKHSPCVRSRFAKDFYNTYENILSNQAFKDEIFALGYYKNTKPLKNDLMKSKSFKGFMFKVMVFLERV